ncbi:hypothetical protein AWB78_08693 [Caballeronia calidae]|uniref:Uncharacterized protein n=1 Tax=Caballeronia calidae TaxID=1777139 RepID=A0A158EP05_9BURK|nr:hypothetical protein AWB78_08693 [Caballeronia calidae]
MIMQILGNGLHAFANSVADDQEQKAPTTQIVRQRIVELDLIDARVHLAHAREQRIAFEAEPLLHGTLQVGRGPAAEFLRIVQNLADDLAPRFRIAPELAFDQHRQSRCGDHEIVDRSRRRTQFRADRHRFDEHRIDLGDGQTARMALDPSLNVCLTDRVSPRLLVERHQPGCLGDTGTNEKWAAMLPCHESRPDGGVVVMSGVIVRVSPGLRRRTSCAFVHCAS